MGQPCVQLASSGLLREWNDPCCLQAFRSFFNREFHFLALFELAVTRHLDGGVVDKDVLAILTADEAVPLGGVEPLNSSYITFRHALNSVWYFEIA